MAQERIAIDILENPDLRDLVEQVRARGTSFVLQVASEDIAVLEPPRRPRTRKSGILTEDDRLFRLIGIGRSNVPGGISERKHEALLAAEGGHHPA